MTEYVIDVKTDGATSSGDLDRMLEAGRAALRRALAELKGPSAPIPASMTFNFNFVPRFVIIREENRFDRLEFSTEEEIRIIRSPSLIDGPEELNDLARQAVQRLRARRNRP